MVLMKKNIDKKIFIPKTIELQEELDKVNYFYKYVNVLKNIFYILIIVSAISILISTFIFPVLKIHGQSMGKTIKEGDISISIKKNNYQPGDVIAFYYNNKILIKRVIATSSDWVNILDNGDVFVNNELLKEDYLKEKLLGESDITYPYQVPEDSYFVLGDNRNNSIDSRNSLIGTVKNEDIIGKVIFKIWPIKRVGFVYN